MKHFFGKRTIRFRMISAIIVMVIGSMLIMLLANRYSIQTRLFRQTSNVYITALNQTSDYISDKLALGRRIMSTLFIDYHIQQNYDFSQNATNEETVWLSDLSIGRVTYKGSLLGVLSRLYYYQGDDAARFKEDNIYASFNEQARESFDAWWSDSSQSYLLIPFTQTAQTRRTQYIYLLAKVPSAIRLGENVGMMCAEMPSTTLEKILASVPSSENSSLYLISSDNTAFIRINDRFEQEDEKANLFAKQMLASNIKAGELTKMKFEGNFYWVSYKDIDGTDWKVMMLVPIEDITFVTRQADRILFGTTLALILIILVFATLFVRGLLNPIYRLHDGVKSISEGNYQVHVPLCGSPEIDQVINSFNFMCKQTQTMMDQQYRLGQELKNRELRVLQEQINPHFLYNTIDLLHWEAREAGSREMEKIISALSRFYRLSLGHGEEIVTLNHEIQLVQAYMQIQNIRFMNRIQMVIDVPDDLLNVRIVKMVLQPLVENSIQHGIREKPNEKGCIGIHAVRKDDYVEISVADDGVGMDVQTISDILSNEHPGYGIYNVNDRLIMHYGNNATLRFNSSIGEGTTVCFRIPFE